MNTYTLTVYKKQGKPCYVVTICHYILAGVYFFKTLQEANDFIARKKTELAIFGELSYSDKTDISDNSLKVIKTVLSCDNIHIGENGYTYFA